MFIDSQFEKMRDKMKFFIKTVSDFKMQSTDTFRQLSVQRDNLKSNIIELVSYLDTRIKRKRYYENNLKQLLNDNELDNEGIKNLFHDFVETVYDEQLTSYHNTRCFSCYSNCHENCSLEEINFIGDNQFKKCAAFIDNSNHDWLSYDYWSNKKVAFVNDDYKCHVCKHSYKNHGHIRSLLIKQDFVYKDQYYLQTLKENDFNTKKTQMIASIEKIICELKDKIVKYENHILSDLNKLTSLFSNFNVLKEIQVIKQILQDRTKYFCEIYEKSKDRDSLENMECAKESQKIVLQILEKWEENNSSVYL